MIDVYYFLEKEKVSKVIDEGLDLSVNFDRELEFMGNLKKCFVGYINPKDVDMKSKEGIICVRFSVKRDACFVAEGALYKLAENNNKAKELYKNSIVPIEKYEFGSYRMPECLIFESIKPNCTCIPGKRGNPILYDSARNLYLEKILNQFSETEPEVMNLMLYYFLNELERCGRLERIAEDEKNVAFIDNLYDERKYIVEKPDISKFEYI